MFEILPSIFAIFRKKKEYKGRNLVEFDAISPSKFVTGVMEILFTRKERFDGICTEYKRKCKDKKTPRRIVLDQAKIKMMKGNFILNLHINFLIFRYILKHILHYYFEKDAFFLKYPEKLDKREASWNQVLLIANRKCYDTKTPNEEDEEEDEEDEQLAEL